MRDDSDFDDSLTPYTSYARGHERCGYTDAIVRLDIEMQNIATKHNIT